MQIHCVLVTIITINGTINVTTCAFRFHTFVLALFGFLLAQLLKHLEVQLLLLFQHPSGLRILFMTWPN